MGLIRTKKPAAGKPATKPNAKIFFGCAAFLALFIGGYIPASVISSSAQEFVNVQMYYSPIWFVINSLCLAINAFVIWFGIFYWLASPKGKVAFEKVLWMLVGVAIVDFMFFGKYLGVLSSTLSFEGGMQFAPAELWGNLLAIRPPPVSCIWSIDGGASMYSRQRSRSFWPLPSCCRSISAASTRRSRASARRWKRAAVCRNTP